jgi:hypothetical protein
MTDQHRCEIVGCWRIALPLTVPDEGQLRRCGLHEIASYNEEELREWGEKNAADMVSYATTQLLDERRERDKVRSALIRVRDLTDSSATGMVSVAALREAISDVA